MRKIFRVAKLPITIRLVFHVIYSVTIASLPYIIKYMIDEVSNTHSVASSGKYIGVYRSGKRFSNNTNMC